MVLLTAGATGAPTMVPFLISMALMFVLFYLMIFLPEKKRKKKYAQMLNDLKVNDEIVTKGGIIGRIISIKDNFLIVESGPDRTRFKIDKNAVLEVLVAREKEEVNEDKTLKE